MACCRCSRFDQAHAAVKMCAVRYQTGPHAVRITAYREAARADGLAKSRLPPPFGWDCWPPTAAAAPYRSTGVLAGKDGQLAGKMVSAGALQRGFHGVASEKMRRICH